MDNDFKAHEWIDKLRITELITKYFQLIDEKNFEVDKFAEVFTDDATLTRPNNNVATGPGEIADSANKSFARFRATQHFATGILVEMNGEEAAVRVNVLAMHLWAEGVGDTNALERYFEGGVVINVSARRTPGGWRITSMQGRNIWRSGSSFGMMQTNNA